MNQDKKNNSYVIELQDRIAKHYDIKNVPNSLKIDYIRENGKNFETKKFEGEGIVIKLRQDHKITEEWERAGIDLIYLFIPYSTDKSVEYFVSKRPERSTTIHGNMAGLGDILDLVKARYAFVFLWNRPDAIDSIKEILSSNEGYEESLIQVLKFLRN